MKLYILEGRGLWEDAKPHMLPLRVEVYPPVETGTAVVGGICTNVKNGRFVIHTTCDGRLDITVNGIACEPLLCSRSAGNRHLVRASEKDLRALLPHLSRIDALEQSVARIDAKLENES